MRTPQELKELWIEVRKIYSETIEQNNARTTADKIVEAIGFDAAKEVFAAVAKIKKHDGRIYGENRKWTETVETSPEALVWDHSNALIHAGLDDIHTTHIDNLITQLRKIEATS